MLGRELDRILFGRQRLDPERVAQELGDGAIAFGDAGDRGLDLGFERIGQQQLLRRREDLLDHRAEHVALQHLGGDRALRHRQVVALRLAFLDPVADARL